MKERTCPLCHGTGISLDDDENSCPECNGYGVIEQPSGDEKLSREELNRE